jgi:hypothetical protein
VQTWFVETPFRTTTTCRFAPDGQTAEITLEINVGFGPTEPVHVHGRRTAG